MSESTCIWFSPVRVGELRTRSRQAIDEIRQLLRWCSDDAASTALRCAARDLEFVVLPTLDRLCATRIFTDWSPSDPEPESGHRRPQPMTPARRSTVLLNRLLEPDIDDSTLIRTANSLCSLLERHPHLASRLVGLTTSTSRPWDTIIRRIAHAVGDPLSSPHVPDAMARLAALAIGLSEAGTAEEMMESLALSASGSTVAGAVVARLSRHLKVDSLELLAEAIVNVPGPPATLGPVLGTGRRLAIEGLLVAVARQPATAGAVLDDSGMLELIANNQALDADAVNEALLAAAVDLTPPVLLARLVGANEHGLSPGAVRAAAAALAASLEILAPVIDAPLVRVPGPSGPVDVAHSEQMRDLMAQIMSDSDARILLGTALGGFRRERLHAALDGAVDPQLDLTEVAAGQLAQVDAIIDLMSDGAADAAKANEAHRASLLSGSRSALLLLGQLATLAVPGSRLVVAGITTTTREIIDLVMAGPAQQSTGADLTDQLAMAQRVGVVEAILIRSEIRVTLGLASVPPTLWEEVDDHVRRFNAALDDKGRSQAHADLLNVVAESIPLSTVVNSLRALSDR